MREYVFGRLEFADDHELDVHGAATPDEGLIKRGIEGRVLPGVLGTRDDRNNVLMSHEQQRFERWIAAGNRYEHAMLNDFERAGFHDMRIARAHQFMKLVELRKIGLLGIRVHGFAPDCGAQVLDGPACVKIGVRFLVIEVPEASASCCRADRFILRHGCSSPRTLAITRSIVDLSVRSNR